MGRSFRRAVAVREERLDTHAAGWGGGAEGGDGACSSKGLVQQFDIVPCRAVIANG